MSAPSTVSFNTKTYTGQQVSMRQRISDEMIEKIETWERERILERGFAECHRQQEELWDKSGVPVIARQCDHIVDSRHEPVSQVTEFQMTCRSKSVTWPVIDTSFTEWLDDNAGAIAGLTPDPNRWVVVGRRDLGKFADEGSALAAAWSVTPAGGKRPEVEKR